MMKCSGPSSYQEFPLCLQLQSYPWGRLSSTWWFPLGGPPLHLRDPLQGRHKIDYDQLQYMCNLENLLSHQQFNQFIVINTVVWDTLFIYWNRGPKYKVGTLSNFTTRCCQITVDKKWCGKTDVLTKPLPTENGFKLVYIFRIYINILTDYVFHPLTLIFHLKRKVQDLENIPFYPLISLLGHFCYTASILISKKQAATSCSL